MDYVYQKTSLRDVLLAEYEMRLRKNPRYSLRAFSKYLKLSPSTLSEVLSEKYGLRSEKLQQVCAALGLGSSEYDYIQNLIEAQFAKTEQRRRAAKKNVRLTKATTANISADHFALIRDWYHLAILELTFLQDFRPDLKWISQRLELPKFIIEGAVERLKRIEALSEKDGKWTLASQAVQTSIDIPSQAIQEFHTQLIEKAKQSLVDQPVQDREYTASICSVSQSQLPEAKKAIREFINQFNIRFAGGKDEVYALSIQFFKLTTGLGET